MTSTAHAELSERDARIIRGRSRSPRKIRIPGHKTVVERVFDLLFDELNIDGNAVPVRTVYEKFPGEREAVHYALHIFRQKGILESPAYGFVRKGSAEPSRQLLKEQRETGLTPSLRAYLFRHGLFEGQLIPVQAVKAAFPGYSRKQIYWALARLDISGMTLSVSHRFIGSPEYWQQPPYILGHRQEEVLYLLVSAGRMMKMSELSSIISEAENKRMKKSHATGFVRELYKRGLILGNKEAVTTSEKGLRAYTELATYSPLEISILEQKYAGILRKRAVKLSLENREDIPVISAQY